MSKDSMEWIANDQLILDLIPSPDASRREIERFALTLDGYVIAGSPGACAEIASSGGEKTLTELRITLFFHQRARRFVDHDDIDETDLLQEDRELIRQIRERVAAGRID